MPTYKEIISKKFGNVIFPAASIIEQPKQIFSVSPAIDIALSGGVPEGSWVSFIGPPGCGKSTTALQLLANAQQEKYNVNGKQRKAFYLDVEHRIKKMNLMGVHGLKYSEEDLDIIRSTAEKQLSAEEFLEILKQIVLDPANYGGIAVIDSTSALCPQSEIGEQIDGAIRSTQPRVMASFCRQMAGAINATNFTIVIIQHLITNTSGWGAKWQVDGGEKIKYQLDISMMTKNETKKYGPDERKPIGQIIEWDVRKSALGQSGTSCTSYLQYGYGLDEIKEVMSLAVDLGIVEKTEKGGWYTINVDGKPQKYQGDEKFAAFLRGRRDVYEDIFAKSKTLLFGEQ